MKRSIRLVFTASLLCIAVVALHAATFGQSRQFGSGGEVQRILDAFQAARPAEMELGVFKLDWAESLADAKARAAQEGRPILFVSTVQTKDAGNLRQGHC